MIRTLLLVLLLLNTSFARDVKPPHRINTVNVIQDTLTHYFSYSHIKIIGICVWLEITWLGPEIYTTLELDQYQPDFLVSVYHRVGTNPWDIGNIFDKPVHELGNTFMQTTTGFELSNGNTSSQTGTRQDNEFRTKSVDVIGHPFGFFHFPFTLPTETTPFLPYYQSDLDTPARLGIAEALRPETWNPFGPVIGTQLSHWAYEFPRTMTVHNSNNYKASLVAALRAMDIVTNNNLLHANLKSTRNSCGKNCVVSNVIEDLSEKHAIWQEIYPSNRHIRLGENDQGIASLGKTDEEKGHGNYVLTVWRHYQGCLPPDDDNAKLLFANKRFSATQKR